MKANLSKSSGEKGISILEVLLAASALAIMATLALHVFGETPESARESKLRADVRGVNAAIDVYRVFGGSLESATTAEEVIAKLQTKADADSSVEMAGLTGNVIDPRMSVKTEEVADGKARAVWNNTNQKFEIAYSGTQGVKEFSLDSSIASIPAATEARESTMKLAKTSTWIWDYEDSAVAASNAPTAIPFTPGTPTVPTSHTPAGTPGVLDPPMYSLAGGSFPISDYNLKLRLTNPNAGISSRIMYQVNGGAWKIYNGSLITVYPGANINAFTESIDPAYANSSSVAHDYTASDAQLKTPVIEVSAPKFDYDANQNIGVVITNPNSFDVSTLEYRLNGGAWQVYSGAFNLFVLDYRSSGTVIEARAVATAPHYLDSDVASTSVTQPDTLFTISGNASGQYGNPIGGSSMVTNLLTDGQDAFFSWGVPVNNGAETTPESSLEFIGEGFVNVSPGVRFKIGSINYFNGTIQSGTGADGIELQVEIYFDGAEARTFNFNLELINVPNNTGTPEGDADYVKLGSIVSETIQTINGEDFRLILEFGETSESGFSTIDEFFVFEGESANGSVYGTLEVADLVDAMVDPESFSSVPVYDFGGSAPFGL